MKLRLTQAGFQNFTGQMGVVWFENGLSTTDVLPIDGVRISAAIGATWEDGTTPNKAEMYLSVKDSPSFVGTPRSVEEPATASSGDVNEAPAAASGVVYTEEALAKIADEKGIAGLRDIGDTLGVKGTSIVGLIAGILKAQVNPRVEG